MPFCQFTLKAKKPSNEAYSRYPENPQSLGDYIRKRRLDLKLTAKDLAKLLRVDMDTVYSWEYNKTSPNPRRLPEIIEFLGGEPDIQIRRLCGEKILAYRKFHKLSQSQLALKLGINKVTLQQWESNRKCPSEKFLKRLSFIFIETSQGIFK